MQTNNTSIMFDVERSLKESPPNYPDGVTFKKRIVVNRKNLIRQYQPRNLTLQITNVAPIFAISSNFSLLGIGVADPSVLVKITV